MLLRSETSSEEKARKGGYFAAARVVVWTIKGKEWPNVRGDGHSETLASWISAESKKRGVADKNASGCCPEKKKPWLATSSGLAGSVSGCDT